MKNIHNLIGREVKNDNKEGETTKAFRISCRKKQKKNYIMLSVFMFTLGAVISCLMFRNFELQTQVGMHIRFKK